jgi:hypothetical protein
MNLRWRLFACLTVIVSLSSSMIGCRQPHMRTFARFKAISLKGQKVLVLPLAVSDDLGDERTGIILDDVTVAVTGRAACAHARQVREDIKIVCFDEVPKQASAFVSDVVLRFAGDEPIDQQTLDELATRTGANILVVFRPESVAVGVTIVQPVTVVMNGSSGYLQDSGKPYRSVEREYTVSTELIELRSGLLLRSGDHGASATGNSGMRGPNDLSDYLPPGVNAPDAAPTLSEIMNELLDTLLDE